MPERSKNCQILTSVLMLSVQVYGLSEVGHATLGWQLCLALSTAVGELRDPAHLRQVPCSELAFVPLETEAWFQAPQTPKSGNAQGPSEQDSTLVNLRGKFSRRKAEERGSHRAQEPGNPRGEEASEPPGVQATGHCLLLVSLSPGGSEPHPTWHSTCPKDGALHLVSLTCGLPCRRSQAPHRPESQVPVICDYGSGFSKLGFAGCEAPYAVFPTVLGKLRHDTMLVGMEEEDWFIGDEVQNKRGILNLQYPISRGAITNWDNMEKIWHHSFYHVLNIAPEEHPLMVTEPPLSKTSTKEKVTQILFETFGVPALYIGNQGVLSLYSSGQTSGEWPCGSPSPAHSPVPAHTPPWHLREGPHRAHPALPPSG
uniref:uncharacterized protein LOC120889967 n=1 Tax=Ictidomys tridecemlineatus TaxID=43179 RepID=UPI001A9EDB2D|nr:uncharacterized protein LOC120889967 [Ictidomys tridecemlineatus]